MSLLACPSTQLVRAYIELPPDLRERHSERASLGDQPHRFRFELGAERASLTPPC